MDPRIWEEVVAVSELAIDDYAFFRTDRGRSRAERSGTSGPSSSWTRDCWVSAGWTSSAKGISTVELLFQVHRILQTRVDAVLGAFDLNFARFEVLLHLNAAEDGSGQASRLSERLQVHQTSVSYAVRRLEVSGYVLRDRSPTDRRIAVIGITDSGRSTSKEAAFALNREVFSVLGLHPEDMTLLLWNLRCLRANAGDF